MIHNVNLYNVTGICYRLLKAVMVRRCVRDWHDSIPSPRISWRHCNWQVAIQNKQEIEEQKEVARRATRLYRKQSRRHANVCYACARRCFHFWDIWRSTNSNWDPQAAHAECWDCAVDSCFASCAEKQSIYSLILKCCPKRLSWFAWHLFQSQRGQCSHVFSQLPTKCGCHWARKFDIAQNKMRSQKGN